LASSIRALVQELDFTYAPLLFELDYLAATSNAAVRFAPVSSFPQLRPRHFF